MYPKDINHMETGGVKELPPMVVINMNNYGTDNIKELDKIAQEYLKSLRGFEFSLEESNPSIRFTISKASIWHLTNQAGLIKLKITRQIREIFKQGIIFSVEDETKGDSNVLHILRCGTYILVSGEVYVYYFILKLKKGDQNFVYDGNIDVRKPEKEKTA